jgi:hypothetical protein
LRSTATRCLIVTALAMGVSMPAVADAADRGDKSAPQIRAVALNPTDVLLPASHSARRTTAFTISMRVSDPSGVDTVVAGLYGPKGGNGHAYRLTRTSGSAANGLWKVVVRLANPQPTGQWRLQAFAVDNRQNSTDPGQVYGGYLVRAATHFAHFDASEPTPVGQDVRFSGFLQRYDHRTGWTGYPGREVVIEFRPAGGKDFRPVQTLRTGADGSVAGATVAKGPGTWRMSFAGNDQWAPSVSRADDVGLPPVTTPPRPAVPPGVRCPGKCPTPTPTPTATPASGRGGTRSTERSTATPSPVRSAQPTATGAGTSSPAPRKPGTRS